MVGQSTLSSERILVVQSTVAAAATCASGFPTIASVDSIYQDFSANDPSGSTQPRGGGLMRSRLRGRFWIEAGLGALSSALFTLTLVLPDWIELVFGVDPDQHSGSLEWVITGVLGVMTVAAVVLARRECERRPLGLSTTR